MTVSSVGRSTPSLNMSTANTMSSSPASSCSSEAARGADVGPEWTATARTPLVLEECRHEVRVPLRDAEAECALASFCSELFEGVLSPTLRGDSGRERLFVETCASPRDVRVVHVIWNAVVVKWREQALAHAFDQIATVDEILLAQRQQIASIGPLGCGGQPQQELWLEVGDQLPVGGGSRVVEFVDDDVVEGVWGEPLEMFSPAESLDGRKHDVGVWVLRVAGVMAKTGLRSNAPEGVESLVQDLLAVGNEEHTAILGTVGIESREPCLSETRCQDHQAGLVPGCSGLLQRGERRSLHSCRCDRRLWGLGCDVRRFDNRSLDGSPGAVRGHPLCGQILRAGMPKQVVESGDGVGVSGAVAR